jgi:hypothetical protein
MLHATVQIDLSCYKSPRKIGNPKTASTHFRLDGLNSHSDIAWLKIFLSCFVQTASIYYVHLPFGRPGKRLVNEAVGFYYGLHLFGQTCEHNTLPPL